MPRTKKRRRPAPKRPLPRGAQRIRSPKTRMGVLFELLEDIPMSAEGEVFSMPLPTTSPSGV